MKRFTRMATAVLILIAVAGVTGTAHADDTFCANGTTEPGGRETTIVGGKPTDPLTLGVQTYTSASYTRVVLCYGTGPYNASGVLAAGSFEIDNWNAGTSGSSGYTYCGEDPTAAISPTCRTDYAATATPAITPTPTSNGLTFTATIPFRVCVGSCVSDSTALAQSGAFIGTLVPQPAPVGSTGAGYELTDVRVVLNGTTVYRSNLGLGGFFVADNGAVATSGITGYTYGPCTVGVCVPMPTGYVKLTGNDPTITINRPVVGGSVPVTVPLPYACLYEHKSGTTC